MRQKREGDAFDLVEAFISNFLLIVGTGWGLVIIWLFLPEPIQGPVLGAVIAVAVGAFFLVFFGGMAICVAMPFVLLGRGAWSLAHRARQRAVVTRAPASAATTGAADGRAEPTRRPLGAGPEFLGGQYQKIVTVATPAERAELDRLLHASSFSYAEEVFWQGLLRRWSDQDSAQRLGAGSPTARGPQVNDSVRRRLATRWEQRNQHRWAR